MRKAKKQDMIKEHDLAACIFGLFFSAVILFTPWIVQLKGNADFISGPLVFPLTTLSISLVACLPSMYRIIRYNAFSLNKVIDFIAVPSSSFVLFLILIAFIPGLYFLGFELTVFILLTFSLAIYGYMKYALPISLIITFAVWFIFRYLLDIFFPEAIIFTLWGNT